MACTHILNCLLIVQVTLLYRRCMYLLQVFTLGMPSQNKPPVFMLCISRLINMFRWLSGEDEKSRDTKVSGCSGEDPNPKPRSRERKLPDVRTKPFYNHCKCCHNSNISCGLFLLSRRLHVLYVSESMLVSYFRIVACLIFC